MRLIMIVKVIDNTENVIVNMIVALPKWLCVNIFYKV